MTIAYERYLAVCVPFKHAHFTRRKVLITFCLIYIMSIMFSFLVLFQVSAVCFSPFSKCKFYVSWSGGGFVSWPGVCLMAVGGGGESLLGIGWEFYFLVYGKLHNCLCNLYIYIC